MRIKRRKTFRRYLQFYKVAFGILEPYRVLLDGTFIQAARKMKILIREQLPKTLLGRATPVVSACIMDELRKFRSELIESVVIAKHFYRHKCAHTATDSNTNDTTSTDTSNEATRSSNHDNASPEDSPDDLTESRHKTPPPSSPPAATAQHPMLKTHSSVTLSARECILDLMGKNNPFHYIVATQDTQLKAELRKIPGVPILSILGPGPMLEPPSPASIRAHQLKEDQKQSAASWEKAHLPSLRISETSAPKKKKRKGKHPLSCLSKKTAGSDRSKATATAQHTVVSKIRRRRTRKRTSSHADPPSPDPSSSNKKRRISISETD